VSGHHERDDRGTSLVEYVLLVALIAVLAMGGIWYFGTSRSASFSGIASKIEGVAVPLSLLF
jgi:Flp pilus assembly pilin Flp